MPNTFFRFKQFTIHQEYCAMKVCTDACLFGSYMAKRESRNKIPGTRHCLDIGTGTGLLSLMLAQETDHYIYAVEIDSASFLQAKANIGSSPWHDRIQVTLADITSYHPLRKYDLVISNPPFFEDDLKSTDEKKNQAKHDSALSLSVLIQQVDKFLTPKGEFAVLLPYHRLGYFIEEAEKQQLFLTEKIIIKQTPSHSWFRGILIFSRETKDLHTDEIIIKDTTGEYSARFVNLLQDYYL